MPRKYTDEERLKGFWSRVKIENLFGCWEWSGCTNGNGYGRVQWDGKPQVASRVSWQITHGVVPEGLWVLHICDNPLCVNPSHLFLGTRQDNIDDMIRKGRAVNLKGEMHGLAKLKLEQVLEIRMRCKQGERQVTLGKEYGVTKYAIWRIIHNKTWRVDHGKSK